MKLKLTILIGLVLVFCIVPIVSAMQVSFFYSETCPHCKSVKPLVDSLMIKNLDIKFNYYNVLLGNYDIVGVPLIKIKTDDCRKIELIGSQEIPRYLECELNKMTTKDCPTYSAGEEIVDSWFIR